MIWVDHSHVFLTARSVVDVPHLLAYGDLHAGDQGVTQVYLGPVSEALLGYFISLRHCPGFDSAMFQDDAKTEG